MEIYCALWWDANKWANFKIQQTLTVLIEKTQFYSFILTRIQKADWFLFHSNLKTPSLVHKVKCAVIINTFLHFCFHIILHSTTLQAKSLGLPCISLKKKFALKWNIFLFFSKVKANISITTAGLLLFFSRLLLGQNWICLSTVDFAKLWIFFF